MSQLNKKGEVFVDYLKRLAIHETETSSRLAKVEKINVVSAGGTITAAYEHLRNAAENIDDHLLRQNAIRRFYRRILITRDEELAANSGSELAIELTLAGYIENDSLTREQIDRVSVLGHKFYQNYAVLLPARATSADKLFRWILDDLAVQVEYILADHMRDMVFADFAYGQMLALIESPGVDINDETSALLYAAVQQALLKSNAAVVRTTLLRRFGASIDDTALYIATNQKIDRLVASDEADRLYRLVNRQSPPLRILKRMVDSEPDIVKLLENRTQFLENYEKAVFAEYERVGERLNRAIVRSIIFLIITKFLVGIAIEVPYDVLMHGEIIWVPLVVNLLFPPVYMYLLRLTLRIPGYANTSALVGRIDSMLYEEKNTLTKLNLAPRRYGSMFSLSYLAISVAMFVAIIYLLLSLRFSVVHIIIFFIFVSAASFLGFRISRNVREIELVKSAAGGVTFIRDMLYLPFVVVGQWLSDKYSKVNIVAIVLDMMIELPMKTILRIIRQWTAFIDDRKDNI